MGCSTGHPHFRRNLQSDTACLCKSVDAPSLAHPPMFSPSPYSASLRTVSTGCVFVSPAPAPAPPSRDHLALSHQMYLPPPLPATFAHSKPFPPACAQDTFAAMSHKKAAAAQAAGKFKDEIVPVHTKVGCGNSSNLYCLGPFVRCCARHNHRSAADISSSQLPPPRLQLTLRSPPSRLLLPCLA